MNASKKRYSLGINNLEQIVENKALKSGVH